MRKYAGYDFFVIAKLLVYRIKIVGRMQVYYGIVMTYSSSYSLCLISS